MVAPELYGRSEALCRRKCFHSGQKESMHGVGEDSGAVRNAVRRLDFLVQVFALGLSSVLTAKPAAALQLGHDQVDEFFDRARAIDRRQHEAVAADEIEIGFRAEEQTSE